LAYLPTESRRARTEWLGFVAPQLSSVVSCLIQRCKKFPSRSLSAAIRIAWRRVVQHHVGQLESALAADLAVLHHPSEGDGQRLAPRLACLPANLLPVDLRSIGVEIGPEQDLLRIPL